MIGVYYRQERLRLEVELRDRRTRLEAYMELDIRGLVPLLQVFDMPASIHFYRDILGFGVVTTSATGEQFDWALLRLQGVELMLNTPHESDERPPVPDASRIAAHGDTGLYFGCP